MEGPLTPGPEAMCIVAHQSELIGAIYEIPSHPITTGSVKLPDWLIWEAEETLENNTRGPTRKAIGNRDPMQRVKYQFSLYHPHENRKVERVRKMDIR